MAALALDDRVTSLLQEAAEWRLIGRLFECPSPEWRDDVARLGREVSAGPLRETARLAEAAREGPYHTMFGPGGPAPPREASYHASVELGSLMSAIEGDYDAFGYHAGIDEPADHVAVEAGFIAYLRFKEAYARASGDLEAAGVTERVSARFLVEHLAVIAHPLASLLADSEVDYLARASALLASRAGPKPATRQLPVIQPGGTEEDSGSEFACDV
jgi:nitrate reductase assembly molybdenum cofactor insertion protein NarJ